MTRTGPNTYRTEAVRADGTVLAIPSYDRSGWLPHDYAHWIVESELGLAHGFLGKVSRGAIFPGMTVLAGRQAPHTAERSRAVQRDGGQAGIEAEEYVDERWEVASRRLHQKWRPAVNARADVTRDELARVCRAIRAAQGRWIGLAVGAGVSVTWPEHRSRRGKRARVFG